MSLKNLKTNLLCYPIKGNAKIHGVKLFVGAYDGDEVITLPYEYLVVSKKYISIVDAKKHFTVYDGAVSSKNAIFRKLKKTDNVGIWVEHHDYVTIKEGK